ncbi:MAG: sensor domain-containing diguanylate cyclase [Polaromonas sp.]|uniref:sensor domain-containing diguanylate cyclase n=1 Tax=Polaromonas sp. TaxID=1869339 RepID=UPI004036D52F
MRYAATLLTTVLLALLATLAAPLRAQPVVVLDNPAELINLQARGLAWIDSSASATITQMAAGSQRALMEPGQENTVYALGPRAVLWQHFRFSSPLASQQDWVLEFPLPLLDSVTVFQQARDGRWIPQSAGDTLPVSGWPEPGRYAQFRLDLQDGGVHDVYVRIQHVTRANIPVNVVSGQVRSHRLQVEYMIIGIVLGAMLLLIVAGAAQCWVYRDVAYGLYAGYATTMGLVIASTSGMAGHLLWPDSAAWNNAAQGVLALLGGCAALLVLRKLCDITGRRPWFDHLVLAASIAGPLLAITYVGINRHWGVRLIGVYLVVVVVLGLTTAFMAWRRKDMVGAWVLAGFTPLALSTLLLVARIFGWAPTSWLSEHALMLSLAFEVPMLLVALNIRSRERHGVEAREQAMASQDALTGLLASHLFHDRLQQVVARATRYKEPAAVVYVELVNYGYIKRTYGIAVAEQSLLRCVIKLRRILRDVDTVGRVDEARFGLILEGVSSREPVTELAARLIAAGLMPLKGLKPEVLLQFHVASVLLKERLMEGPDIATALGELLSGMAPRSRRPIRFLEPELTRPMPMEEVDSELDDQEPESLPAT